MFCYGNLAAAAQAYHVINLYAELWSFSEVRICSQERLELRGLIFQLVVLWQCHLYIVLSWKRWISALKQGTSVCALIVLCILCQTSSSMKWLLSRPHKCNFISKQNLVPLYCAELQDFRAIVPQKQGSCVWCAYFCEKNRREMQRLAHSCLLLCLKQHKKQTAAHMLLERIPTHSQLWKQLPMLQALIQTGPYILRPPDSSPTCQPTS